MHCMAQHSGEQFHQIKRDCTIKIDIGFTITPDRHVHLRVCLYRGTDFANGKQVYMYTYTKQTIHNISKYIQMFE